MTKDCLAELINKISIVQGEAQRAMIWLKRFYDDLDEFKKEVLKDVDIDE